MRARAWQIYLDEQRRVHGKAIFSVTELANVAGTSRNALNVEINRLRKQGIIEKYAHGTYGLPGVVAESLVQSIDPHAYVTGLYALNYHGLVTQVATRTTCFTDRRSPRTRVRRTSVGRLFFVCVRSRVYNPPGGGMASPEQAICDFVYLLRRKGLTPEGLVTFCNLGRLQTAVLDRIFDRYPMTVQESVRALVSAATGAVISAR